MMGSRTVGTIFPSLELSLLLPETMNIFDRHSDPKGSKIGHPINSKFGAQI